MARGGARPGAGRKKQPLSDELRALMDEACPLEKRKDIVWSITARAEAGDPVAATFIFNRCYGTPRSGDELELEERLEAAIASVIDVVKEICSASDAQKVLDRLAGAS